MKWNVVYSHDLNVLRAQSVSDPKTVRFIPFMLTGRKLRPYQLEQVAMNTWGTKGNVMRFTYLGPGEGCPGTDKETIRPSRRRQSRY